jgi:hypothetical protein
MLSGARTEINLPEPAAAQMVIAKVLEHTQAARFSTLASAYWNSICRAMLLHLPDGPMHIVRITIVLQTVGPGR